MAVVDLEEVKAHLNQPPSEDDDLLEGKIDAAQDFIERQLGYKIATEYPSDVPPALKEAVLQLVAHWYENREAALVGINAQTLPAGMQDIITSYRNWSWADA